jgi:transposase
VKGLKQLEMDEARLDELSGKLLTGELSPEDRRQLKAIVDTVRQLALQYQQAKTSLKRLLKIIFGSGTEKTDKVLKREPKTGSAAVSGDKETKPKRKGHGRLGVDDYPGAEKVCVEHGTLKPGDKCPACQKGRLGARKKVSEIVHIAAQPLFKATQYILQILRCNSCQATFTATAPPDAGQEKYDDNVAAMIAAARYGYGLPLNRLADMQMAQGVPMPIGTQWELLAGCYKELQPVIGTELQRQAAAGKVLHNDDTPARILAVEKEIREQEAKSDGKKKIRTGVFTTGIVSVTDDRRIALFFSGREHAGENLQKVLDLRPGDLPAPIQMSDALSRNVPESKTIQSNCNIHGRREFVDIADNFPDECAHVLDTIKSVYKYESDTVEQGMTPEQRLLYHQANSRPLMEELKRWMELKLANKEVEPNSGLGSAINYELKHWGKLTLFLEVAGAPLDNNICERILKAAIRHRDNSLFYKTTNGAHVGDFFMSVIQTCRLNGKNPFHYLTTIRKFINQIRGSPAAWMPWNYQATVAALGPP